MSDDFLSLGIQAAQAGNYPLAQEYLSQAVRSTPNSAHAWYWLGLVLEDPQKKKYCLDRAASLGPTPADDSQPLASLRPLPRCARSSRSRAGTGARCFRGLGGSSRSAGPAGPHRLAQRPCRAPA